MNKNNQNALATKSQVKLPREKAGNRTIVMQEEEIWLIINAMGTKKPDVKWASNIYSPKLSVELRQTLVSLIGTNQDKGWEEIKFLLKKYGDKKELIYATGLCQKKEARDWLLSKLESNNEINLEVLKALSCWGGSISKKVISRILKEHSLEIRISGLDLLAFKAHQLSDSELIDICTEIINDPREEVVITAIKIIQRRDSEDICNLLCEIAQKGSENTSKFALQAIGSICSEYSKAMLIDLSQNLPTEIRRNLAKKQLRHQYRD